MTDKGACCAYLFLDESGNLDFSDRGTRHFVLTSVGMVRPFRLYDALDAYKYDCLEYGLENEHFHCAEDNRYVRGRVFDIIGGHLDAVSVDSLIVEKRKTNPALTGDRRFYPEMLGYLLKHVLSRQSNTEAEEVIVITDTIPLQKRRQAIEKAVKHTLARMLPPRHKYRILHHDSRSHYGLQIADYCCWAISRKWRTGERTWYDRIKPAVCSEVEILHGKMEC